MARAASRLGKAVSTISALSPRISRAICQIRFVGPVSPLKTNPVSPSWITKPVVGTVCSTSTGVTHSSPTRDSASSGGSRKPSTDWAADGMFVKFGQSVSLKAWVRSDSMTGAMLQAVTRRSAATIARVSVRKASPAV